MRLRTSYELRGRSAIVASGLSKRYRLGQFSGTGSFRETIASLPRKALQNRKASARRSVWALRDVSFTVERGEVLGIIGRNGAGKTTLLKILARITAPTEGCATILGRVGSLLEVGTGFHPDLTGRENVFLNGAILGMARREIVTRFDEIVSFAGVADFVGTPVKRYSSGMRTRLAFAVAAFLPAEILFIDEVLAVGDTEFQSKCLRKIRDLSTDASRTVLFVSHNMGVIRTLCDRALYLEEGRLVGDGPVDDQIARYLGDAVGSEAEFDLAGAERSGRGPVRIQSVRCTDSLGRPRSVALTGDPWRLEIAYESAAVSKRLRWAVSLYDVRGEKVVHLDSKDAGAPDIPSRANGRISVVVPRLPLPPGRYACDLLVEADGQTSDHLQGQIQVTVEVGDYYRTGRVAPSHGAAVLVDHEWQVEESS